MGQHAATTPETDAGKLRHIGAAGARRLRRLSEEHRSILCEANGAARLLARLTEIGSVGEAVSLLSYALPEREAVWWACMCVEQSAPADFPPAQRHALAVAREWVRLPSSTTEWACVQAAKQSGGSSPAAFAVRAAFAAKLDRASSLHAGRRVEKAVLAAASGDPERSRAWLAHFILVGRDIAAGGSGRLGRGASR